MHYIGIMQGRLTEPKGRGIQFFPFDNWENEFVISSKIEINEIEFIFDYENYTENPLWTENGLKKIRGIIEKTKVKVNSICFDYFMRRPFFKESDEESRERIRKKNKLVLKKIIDAALDIGARLIEIPLVDNSSLKNDEEKSMFRSFIKEVDNKNKILLGLETDLPPSEFKSYLDSFDIDVIRANYDSGNSSGLGYDHYKELTTLNGYVENIHIKDRVYKGTTVELGTGSADFGRFFNGVKEIGYKKSFILQAARGEDGKEVENIRKQIVFLKDNFSKYGLD